MIEKCILYALASYAATFVIASSSLFSAARALIRRKLPELKLGDYPHFIDCRMCVGFWCSLLVCWGDWRMVLPVYGLSYFLATQER